MKKSYIFFSLFFLHCPILQAYENSSRFTFVPLAFLYHQQQSSSSFQSDFDQSQHAMRTNFYHQSFSPYAVEQPQQATKTLQEKIKKLGFFTRACNYFLCKTPQENKTARKKSVPHKKSTSKIAKQSVLNSVQKHTAQPKAINQAAKNNNPTKTAPAHNQSMPAYLKINPQTAAFLQMHNIDVAQFQQMTKLPAQDQVTRELVNILNSVATHAPQYQNQMHQAQLTKHCAKLASLSQQAHQLLQRAELTNFNMGYKKIFGAHFFDIAPKSSLALAGIVPGIEEGVIISGTQTTLTNVLTQTEKAVVGTIVRSGASSLVEQPAQVIRQEIAKSIGEQTHSIVQLHDIVQQEISQVIQQPIINTDLSAPIHHTKYLELQELAPQIRQLQDLAKYTNNFTNLENLIQQDICYLNRIYELQAYRAQIKNFLDMHKPYFIHDNQTYFIEDIASYHIHAGDYFIKDNPSGAHSNYHGNKLNYFNPELLKEGPLSTADVMLYNSRFKNRTKPSSIYPETWSEYVCDLKAIEVAISNNVEIRLNKNGSAFILIGKTSDNLEILIHYDIKTKKIKTHHSLINT